MKTLMRYWRRLFGCTICHRAGVIIEPGCDCGHASWSLEPHEPWCSTYPCPKGCKAVATRAEAVRLLGKHAAVSS
jgi:hypothetical protein